MNVFTLVKSDDSYIREVKPLPEDVSGQLNTMRDIIKCSYVDVMNFDYKDNSFDVWFDEEFLLNNEHPTATLILGNLKQDSFVILCGNLIFTKHDGEGATVGLTDEEIKLLWEYTDLNSLKLHVAFKQGLVGCKK